MNRNNLLSIAALAMAGVAINTSDFKRFRVQKRYPEQSKRQALRGHRRAQGGPGLTEGADPQPRIRPQRLGL